ncbi:MAG: type II toxin-antitoxin system VapC family toxin [Acetobacteraceae bacterium]
MIATTRRRTPRAAVVDASVAVKWVFAEDHTEAALRLLNQAEALLAPVHWLAEAANALWAKSVRGDLSEPEVHERVAFLVGAPIATTSLDQLASAAMTIALRIRITMYDALYLALAEQRSTPLVTADRRLFETASHDKGLRGVVRWVGDL